VIEGPRAVEGALERGAVIDAAYFGPRADIAFGVLTARLRELGIRCSLLKEGVLERVGSTVTPQPVLVVARKPPSDPDVFARDGLVVVGVALADPGNVGTLLRSAEASGTTAIVLSAGSVDAYNPKVVRASAGAIFGVQVIEGWSAVDALDALGSGGRRRWGAVARGGTPYHAIDFREPVAVVLGNEAHGLGDEIAARLDGWLSVPMRAPAESLNVAMAGTVVCFEAARQRAGTRP
jgi:TrmH family RNA methyltransferase